MKTKLQLKMENRLDRLDRFFVQSRELGFWVLFIYFYQPAKQFFLSYNN